MSPEQHDKIVAAVSHLPQIVSTTLVNTLKSLYLTAVRYILPSDGGNHALHGRIVSG